MKWYKLPDHYRRKNLVRIGRDLFRVRFSLGKWHLLAED